MDQPWYLKLLHRRPPPPPATTESKANGGDADAQFSLGRRFERGDGIAADEVLAVEWYRKAADQAHAPAQFNLGMMFAIGRGTAQDDVEAQRWILQAAEQGHAGTQHNLGVRNRRAGLRGRAEDVAESNVEAYKWFRLAAAQGHNGSECELENLTNHLSREQVVEGDQRATRFLAHPSTPVHAEESHGPTLKV